MSLPRRAIGIDLGTTHSLVSAYLNGRPRCLPCEEGDSPLLPSVVHYGPEGGARVGRAAQALKTQFPSDTIQSVKRLMGRGPDDPQAKAPGPYRLKPGGKVVRFEVGNGQLVTPVEVSAAILRTLKRRAETQLLARVEQAVITVPARFDDAQRQATRDAGRLAGLEVLRLLNEPTAAALAYGLDQRRQGTFAVYDLGGGTFDISILHLVDGVFAVKATGGDTALGGDDLDQQLVRQHLEATGESPTPERLVALWAEARAARELLSEEEEVDFLGQRLTRETFERWVLPLVQKTGLACRRALKDAGLTPAEVDGVVLVGGATRTPLVRRFVRDLFSKEPLVDLDPDQVVAMGAAIQADLLTRTDRRDEVLLLDVTSLSLGLETMGGVVERLIPRNATVPVSASQIFTTFQDGQTAMDIHVVQGERELVEHNRSLARFRLSPIPPMPASMGRVEVSFRVDADGILHVAAKELTTGVCQNVDVRPSHGLSEDELDQMLLDAFDHAEEDVRAKLLREKQVEAERILLEARKQLDHFGPLLEPGEQQAIELAWSELASLKAFATHPEPLSAAMRRLDEVSAPFAERVMTESIRKVVRGHSIEEF